MKPSWAFLIGILQIASAQAVAQVDCTKLHQNFGYSWSTASSVCRDSFERSRRIENFEIQTCLIQAKSLLNQRNLNPAFGLLCLYGNPNEASMAIRNFQCLERYNENLSSTYLINADLARLLVYDKNSGEFFNGIIKQCRTPNPPPPVKSQVPHIHSRTVFHSFTQLGDAAFPLGGLSGLTTDNQNNLYAVSDNRDYPHVLKFQYKKTSASSPRIEVMLSEINELKGAYTDLEDLAIDKDHHFIFSSEEIPGRTFKVSNPLTGPNSYIFKLTQQGDFVDNIPVQEYFYSNTLELDALCGKKEESDIFSAIVSFFSRSPTPKRAESSPQNQARCELYRQTNGIQFNRGIEGISLDISKNFLYYAPEQPLLQKNGQAKTLPLVEQDLRSRFNRLYNYPLDETNDNGVVALLKVKNRSLLVLERGYNPSKKEALVRLYKTELLKEEGTLKKELLIDFQDFLHDMPEGLNKVDNFEGLTFGPTLPGSKPSLVFVSDNNLSFKQKTDFIIFEVPQSWLE